MKEEVILDHSDFIAGIKNKTITLEILQPNKESQGVGFFESGSPSSIINMIFILLTWSPLLTIPFICSQENNWWLLFGFIGIFFGMVVTGFALKTSNPKKEFAKSLLSFIILPAVLIYYLGIFHTLTFISICFYYELLFTMLSNLVYDELVKNNLLKDSNSYYGAQIAGRIRTYRISYI